MLARDFDLSVNSQASNCPGQTNPLQFDAVDRSLPHCSTQNFPPTSNPKINQKAA
jgi:hypothetical protein